MDLNCQLPVNKQENIRGLSPPIKMSFPVLAGVRAIAAGRAHTCALMTTGGVRCWGDDYYGELGDGAMAYRSTPSPVVGICV